MSVIYAPRPISSTPYALMAFFAVMLLALVAATAFVQIKTTQASQAESADTYVPAADEDVPVTDAVVEKSQI